MYRNYKSKGKWWGLLLVLVGIFLVLSQLGIVPVFTWSQIVGALLLGIAVIKLCYLEFWSIATPTLMGLWFLSNSVHPLSLLFSGTSWLIFLIAGLLIDGGLKYLFKPKFDYYGSYFNKRGHKYNRKFDETIIDVDVDEEDTHESNYENTEKTQSASNDNGVFYINAKLGSVTRYITSSVLKEVYVEASIAGVELYFNRSKMKDGEAHLHINASMSGAEIYVPREWTVRIQLSPMLGGVEEVGSSTGDGSQILYINGKVQMSGVEIIYV